MIGDVGSGKSSLLSSITGDMIYIPEDEMEGSGIDSARVLEKVLDPDMRFETKPIRVNGSLSHASSNPWIQNKTIRDNILFGLPFDRTRYLETIKTCQLVEDINALPAGDM